MQLNSNTNTIEGALQAVQSGSRPAKEDVPSGPQRGGSIEEILQPEQKGVDFLTNTTQPEQKRVDEDILRPVQYLVGDIEKLEKMAAVPVKPVFDERVVGFLGALSRELMHAPEVKAYSDVMSYAFWIRKQSLAKEAERFMNNERRRRKLGRGIAFHIAPSNVAVNFAVSFTSALLAGNPCIVRVSNKEFEQVVIITRAIHKVMDTEYSDMKDYLVIVRYDHSEKINSLLSSICDIRIVWGGNHTLYEVRKALLPPRAIELAFPDRHSIAVIDAEAYLKEDAKKIADLFYIDTYFTDQNACSSPRLVVWMGERIEEAKKRFYDALSAKLETEYDMAPILAIDKWNAFCEFSATHEGVKRQSMDNRIMRVSIERLTEDLMDYKMGGGYFFDYDTDDLNTLVPILHKACQTISYLGVEPKLIYTVVRNQGVKGVDRIVPLGHTMDLSFFWDGYDMIDTMSRYVEW